MSSLTETFADQQDKEDRPCLHYPSAEVDFSPQAWMPIDIIDTTGSYAYALNIPQLGETKPGFVYYKPVMDDAINSMGIISITAPEQMEKRLHEDGLFYLNDMLPEKGHVIAFFGRDKSGSGPKKALHAHEVLCVRRDSNGGWSYRVRAGCPSPSIPQQTDWSGNAIKNIRDAHLGPYKNFLGYAGIPYEGLLYYPRLSLSDAALKPFTDLPPALEPAKFNLGL